MSSINAATRTVFNRISASVRRQTMGNWHELTFGALGSPGRVRYEGQERAVQSLPDVITGWLAEFEARYSRFIPTSLVCRINALAGQEWVETDPETDQLLA